MTTHISEVFDLFMVSVTDYRLTDLFNLSEDDFETYLEGFLEYAIAEFDMCDQDLDFNSTTKLFPETLTRKNKTILATLMMKYWLQKLVNDITQMNLHVTDRDFRVASEAMNLREKTIYLNTVKEQCSQLLNNYEYKNNAWDDWFNQSFEGA
jgi:hypothetical protein